MTTHVPSPGPDGYADRRPRSAAGHTTTRAATPPASDAVPALRVTTRSLPAGVELDAAVASANDGLACWIRDGDGLVGSGVAARFAMTGPTAGDAAEAWWREVVAAADVDDPVKAPGSGLTTFGSFPFDPRSADPACLVVPRVVVGRRHGRAFVTTVETGTPRRGEMAAPVPVPVATRPDEAAGAPVRPPGQVRFADGALSGPAWEGVVAAAVRRINAGEVHKVVLARDLVACADAAIDPRWLVARLLASYPQTWTFAVAGLVGATPELLIRRESGRVTSRVLAGTVWRGRPDETDAELAARLTESAKNRDEHAYAARSVGLALAPHCSSLTVPDTPSVIHLPNVAHLASDVEGVAADGATSLALARSLHPSAAVGGTPTGGALRLIREIEGMDRGRYAGPVGWMDATGDGAWGIALRCGRLDDTDPRTMRLFAGGGIVAGSDPATELAETDAKFVPMRDALTAPEHPGGPTGGGR